MRLPVLNERAGSSPLPPLYAAWVDDLLDGAIPSETEATCDDCVMCESQSGDASPPLTGDRWFDPGTKCCTYLPLLPNYLVGRILLDDDPEMAPGVASTRRRIEEGLAVTPLGLGRGTDFHVIYKSNPGEVFGRHTGLKCPHQRDDGMCGIWLHRNAICATWFCKHSRGAAGIRFWSAILQLLEVVERELAIWCVLEVGLDEVALTRLLNFREVALNDSGRNTSQSDVQRWQQTWGTWHDRRAELYRACAKLVESMKWADVAAKAGPAVRAAAELVKQAYGRYMIDESPAQLKVGPFRVIQMRSNAAVVTTYSGFDPIELPAGLLQLLPMFDGRPVGQVIEEIQQQYGAEIEPGLIQRLIDFDVLIPA